MLLCLAASRESIVFEDVGGEEEGCAAVVGIDSQPTSSGGGRMLDSGRRGRFGLSGLGRFATGALGKVRGVLFLTSPPSPNQICMLQIRLLMCKLFSMARKCF
ncbi:hypothetical protein KIN20_022705 [Parelaphostrongylus tenuis]|uniref:Uncharacterized protein n=1 Tax=Parelaphostrongylus tenuis TaxID=148309 RepID=A0AAD5QVJ4_PARTN|nr:hypothetical protein KIN20_022705 [Parelaphostrongylus tenuis]